jgi:putative nucleotidyltransferase with HDIG domain
MALDPSVQEQQLVAAARERRFTPLHASERRAEMLLGGGFVVACVVLLIAAPPWWGAIDGAAVSACAIALALASRVHFVVGPGYTVPTQLAFIPLAFALPAALVAPTVASILAANQLVDVGRGRLPLSRVALVPGNCWFAIGPAAVMALAESPTADETSLSLLALVVVAQIAVDLTMSAVRDALHQGIDARALLDAAWVYAVDAALTPIAFVAALAQQSWPLAGVATIPLLAVLALFARQREAHLASLIELNQAYRGTALVLGDVVEADDSYTGEHSRGVVALALDVGALLGLDANKMRNLEFGALLHDVGKVAIPKDIINKPGKLDPAEWTIIKTHTIEGQRMLDRVGGFMRDVGLIVRSHHERWDGSGYPDGLSGERIPVEARIIACCDTWNAMTTTRSYRAAMPFEAAVAELRLSAGTQLDPGVVDALLACIQHLPRGDNDTAAPALAA